MKISREFKTAVFIAFILALPGLALISGEDIAGMLGAWSLWCLTTFALALVPAAIVSIFHKFKSFFSAWVGSWIGGWSGFFAGVIACIPFGFNSIFGDLILPLSFFTGFIGGAILGAQFKGASSKEKPVEDDLGYVLSEESIRISKGLKAA